MLKLRRAWPLIVLALLAGSAALAYLRDPPWLLTTSSGVREWEKAADGTRFRWAGAHASLFVPSNARIVHVPLRTTFGGAGEWPVTVSIAIDDVPVDRVVLSDPSWRECILRMPPFESRRVRRLDFRTDRTRGDNRAVQLGEITFDDLR